MARDIIRTPNAPSPPATYSQAVRAAGLVFVSGTGPHDPVTGKIVGETIQEQTRQCLENVSAILQAAGSSLERVVSATVILLEETDFAGMNEEWIKWFPANPPARQGAKLPVRIPGMRVPSQPLPRSKSSIERTCPGKLVNASHQPRKRTKTADAI
jgi:2-iminobutanoate/2-iminopropanoate deaminase